jgi:opacity protein-like surface antigen
MNFLVIAMLLFWTAALQPARAEIKKGQRMVVFGAGPGATTTELNSLQNTDLDHDGTVENLKQSQKPGSNGVSGFIQYIYFPTPFLGAGLEINGANFPTNTIPHFNLGNAPVSRGNLPATDRAKIETRASLLQCLATARYVIAPKNRLNPYLLAGLGVNTFQASSDIIPLNPGPQESHWDRNSIGAALAVGGGLQTSLFSDKMMLGVEGRWSYSTVDSKKFGTDGVSYHAAYFWVGYKWTPPL